MAAILLFLPWIVAGGVGTLGLLANWYFGITDWKTAAIFVAVIVSVAIVAQSNSVWSRFIVVAIIAFGCYLKGHVDGVARIEAKYEAARIAESKRQQDANDAAQKVAEEAKAKLEAEQATQNEQKDKLGHEAQLDANADRECLGADAIKRTNQLRNGKPEPETPRSTRPKGPAPDIDKGPTRTPRIIGKHKVASTDRSRAGLRRDQIRTLQAGAFSVSSLLSGPRL